LCYFPSETHKQYKKLFCLLFKAAEKLELNYILRIHFFGTMKYSVVICLLTLMIVVNYGRIRRPVIQQDLEKDFEQSSDNLNDDYRNDK